MSVQLYTEKTTVFRCRIRFGLCGWIVKRFAVKRFALLPLLLDCLQVNMVKKNDDQPCNIRYLTVGCLKILLIEILSFPNDVMPHLVVEVNVCVHNGTIGCSYCSEISAFG